MVARAAAVWLGLLPSCFAAQAGPAGAEPAGTPGPAVTVMFASRQPLIRAVTAIGSLVPREDVLVGADLNGYLLTSFAAEEGDHVEAGQVLARLSTDMLEVQHAEKIASVMRYDAAIDQARSLIAQMESGAIQTSAALDRAQRLLKVGAITQDVLDQRLSAATSARAQLDSAKQGMALAQADQLLAEAQRRELELELTKAEIRAPTNGTVLSRSAQIGQLVSPASGALFHIARDGVIELAGNVVESSLPEIAVGQAVSIHVQGVPNPIRGEIRLISPEVDKTTRLGRVRITLPAIPELTAGTFARADVEVLRHQGIVVPPSAVLLAGSRASVKVVVGGKVATRLVELGMRDPSGIEIVDGIAVGDIVVVRAGAFLNDGDDVTPVTAASASQQG